MGHLGIRLTSFLFFFFVLFSTGCKLLGLKRNKTPQPIGQRQMALGNPSGATADASNHNNFLLVKPQYALSYNRDRGIPNWVSWHLTKEWFGDAPRVKEFRPDPFLPEGWHRVSPQSYNGSGFDLGHHVPPADRTKSAEDYSAVFLMTNIFPQAPELNQITWAFLEDFTRNQVHAGQEVFLIMGSYGTGGKGAKGPAETIDQGRVTVPDRIWRVMVIVPEGEGGLDRITTDTRVIAVDVPNDNNVTNTNWGTYRTSVDAIEQATGYDLLSQVPKKIQEVIEARVDDGPTR